jgi:hypothetical protein
MTDEIIWEEDPNNPMPEEERKTYESYIRRGVGSLPDNNLVCEICKAISHFSTTPKENNVYECDNCKTVFILCDVKEYDRRYTMKSIKFRNKKEYDVFLTIKTKEEFKKRFHRNENRVFEEVKP